MSPTPTNPTDRLRAAIEEALLTTRRTGYDGAAAHGQHRYDARCALCAADVEALTEAVVRRVLGTPTTNTETPAPAVDRATVLTEAADAADTVAAGLRGDSAVGAYAVMQDLYRMADEAAAEAQQPAPAVTEEPTPKPPSTATLLADPCDACQHTLNWHRNDIGCTVPRCVCGQFPATEEPK
ncbi:hypothetical protein [[Kitasatospora] papulosa]|uniref:hypothetical protein n=1 Tax=[Kitasatospora] papulosa TaxID=1464011 RepID=UPI00363D3E95